MDFEKGPFFLQVGRQIQHAVEKVVDWSEDQNLRLADREPVFQARSGLSNFGDNVNRRGGLQSRPIGKDLSPGPGGIGAGQTCP
jgi:hypothetical protein